MRPFSLIRVAASAEMLRLRRKARRTVSRAIFGVIALALLFAALLFAHLAGWYWLRLYLPPHFVALIFMGVDMVVAVILALLAARSSPGEAELGALAVRERALEDVAVSLSLSALAMRIFETVMASRRGR